jgi:hypothetical protein
MFTGFLTNICDIEHTALDEFGEPTLSHEVGVPCRIDYSNRIAFEPAGGGVMVMSYACVMFGPVVNLTETDRIKFDGRWHGVQKIERVTTRRAVHHLEVYVD